MNLIGSDVCCVCLEGKPDSSTYNGDWVFKPNAQQRADKIRHVNPVRMHNQDPRKEINPITGKLEVAINRRTGKALRGNIHWCCETCIKTLESREQSDEYPCPLCRDPVIKRDVLERMAIIDDILEKKFTRALNTLKRLYTVYNVHEDIDKHKLIHLLTVAEESLKHTNGKSIFQYILELGVMQYDTELVIMSAATKNRDAAALKLCYDFSTVLTTHSWHEHDSFLMYIELERCIQEGSKNIEFVKVFLDYGANPLYVKMDADDKVSYLHRPARKTVFTLFLETARDLDKSMQSLYKQIYIKFMKKIMKSTDLVPWSSDTMQRNINRMFSDEEHNSDFPKIYNPYTWVGDVAIMRQLQYTSCFYNAQIFDVFPVALEMNSQSAMFDFKDFLEDDFESVILPRLEFFYQNNVNYHALENGLTPITSVLNHAYQIDIQDRQQEFDIDIQSKIRVAQRKRIRNIMKMTKFFVEKGVSTSKNLNNTRLNANNLAQFLSTMSRNHDYQNGLIDELDWPQTIPMIRWPLDGNGNVRECLIAFENGQWNPPLDRIVRLFTLPGSADVLTLYLGKLSRKTALMYLEEINKENSLWENDSIETFKQVVGSDVPAYNEHEKINDFEKKDCLIPTNVEDKHFGWHPILQPLLAQLSRCGFFALIDISTETLQQLKSFPVDLVYSILYKAMFRYQARNASETFHVWVEKIITSCC
jgi:predicted RNA-binding Zn-ribbon protein involved in translation (DUF1610 family)